MVAWHTSIVSNTKKEDVRRRSIRPTGAMMSEVYLITRSSTVPPENLSTRLGPTMVARPLGTSQHLKGNPVFIRKSQVAGPPHLCVHLSLIFRGASRHKTQGGRRDGSPGAIYWNEVSLLPQIVRPCPPLYTFDRGARWVECLRRPHTQVGEVFVPAGLSWPHAPFRASHSRRRGMSEEVREKPPLKKK